MIEGLAKWNFGSNCEFEVLTTLVPKEFLLQVKKTDLL